MAGCTVQWVSGLLESNPGSYSKQLLESRVHSFISFIPSLTLCSCNPSYKAMCMFETDKPRTVACVKGLKEEEGTEITDANFIISVFHNSHVCKMVW